MARRVGRRIGDAEHEQEARIRMERAGVEPFPPVDHEVVAVARDRGLEIGRIG